MRLIGQRGDRLDDAPDDGLGRLRTVGGNVSTDVVEILEGRIGSVDLIHSG